MTGIQLHYYCACCSARYGTDCYHHNCHFDKVDRVTGVATGCKLRARNSAQAAKTKDMQDMPHHIRACASNAASLSDFRVYVVLS